MAGRGTEQGRGTGHGRGQVWGRGQGRGHGGAGHRARVGPGVGAGLHWVSRGKGQHEGGARGQCAGIKWQGMVWVFMERRQCQSGR